MRASVLIKRFWGRSEEKIVVDGRLPPPTISTTEYYALGILAKWESGCPLLEGQSSVLL